MISAPFTASRLTVARMRRGLSKVELANLTGLSSRIITAYESGQNGPSEENLRALANALKFPREFFGASPVDIVPPEGASFRSLSKMTAGDRNSVQGAAVIAIEINRLLETKFDMPPPRVPDLRGLDPEQAATALRAQWEIGVCSISNVVHLAEANGIRVFSLSDECARTVDGFSLWHRGTPFVFLNPHKSGERGRFDCGHEIGHLVLHQHGTRSGRAAEVEADKFASAFLMPAESVIPVVPPLPSLDTILKLKELWKVSVAAMARRLHDLGLVTPWQYKSLCIEIARCGWRTSEPNSIHRESSLILTQVFAALRSQGPMARASFAHEACISIAELDSFAFGLAPSALEGGAAGTGSTKSGANLHLVKGS